MILVACPPFDILDTGYYFDAAGLILAESIFSYIAAFT